MFNMACIDVLSVSNYYHAWCGTGPQILSTLHCLQNYDKGRVKLTLTVKK